MTLLSEGIDYDMTQIMGLKEKGGVSFTFFHKSLMAERKGIVL